MKGSWMALAVLFVTAAVAQTTLPAPEIKLSAKDFTGPRQAPSPSTPDGFLQALTGPANKCAALGYRAHMETQLDYRSDGTQSARAKLEACIVEARQSGTDAYKAFAAGPASAAMKASAKDVFAAWLAYLPEWSHGERGTQTEANYKQAYSRFQVDAAAQ